MMNALLVWLTFLAVGNTHDQTIDLSGKWAMYKISREDRVHYPREPWQTDTLILTNIHFERRYQSIDKAYKIHQHISSGEYSIKGRKILFTSSTCDGVPAPDEKLFVKFEDNELIIGTEIIPLNKRGERDYHASIYKLWRYFKKMP